MSSTITFSERKKRVYDFLEENGININDVEEGIEVFSGIGDVFCMYLYGVKIWEDTYIPKKEKDFEDDLLCLKQELKDALKEKEKNIDYFFSEFIDGDVSDYTREEIIEKILEYYGIEDEVEYKWIEDMCVNVYAIIYKGEVIFKYKAYQPARDGNCCWALYDQLNDNLTRFCGYMKEMIEKIEELQRYKYDDED